MSIPKSDEELEYGIPRDNECECDDADECVDCSHRLKCPYCGNLNYEKGWATYTRTTCWKCKGVILNPKNREAQAHVDTSLPIWKQMDLERKRNEEYFRELASLWHEIEKQPQGFSAVNELMEGQMNRILKRGLALLFDRDREIETLRFHTYVQERDRSGFYNSHKNCHDLVEQGFSDHWFIKVQGCFGPREFMVMSHFQICETCDVDIQRFIFPDLSFSSVAAGEISSQEFVEGIEKFFEYHKIDQVFGIEKLPRELTLEEERKLTLRFVFCHENHNFTRRALEYFLKRLNAKEEKPVLREALKELMPIPKAVVECVIMRFF